MFAVFAKAGEGERLAVLLQSIQHPATSQWRGDPTGGIPARGAHARRPVGRAPTALGWPTAWRCREPRATRCCRCGWVTLLGGIGSISRPPNRCAPMVRWARPMCWPSCRWPWRVPETSDGRWLRNWVWWPVALLLGVAAFANLDCYFDKQANDFSTGPPTRRRRR